MVGGQTEQLTCLCYAFLPGLEGNLWLPHMAVRSKRGRVGSIFLFGQTCTGPTAWLWRVLCSFFEQKAITESEHGPMYKANFIFRLSVYLDHIYFFLFIFLKLIFLSFKIVLICWNQKKIKKNTIIIHLNY